MSIYEESNLYDRVPDAVRDYLKQYRYKLEIHAHTSPVSPCSELAPDVLISMLKAEGYDGVVITNHFWSGGRFMKTEDPVGTYLADFYAAKEAGAKQGMTVLLGAEIRFNENHNDYLIFGADEPFLREAVKHFDMTSEEFYSAFRSEERIFLQAHPMRDGMVLKAPDSMDAIEAMNMHPHHNSRPSATTKYAREARIPVLTVGTDLHHPGHQGVSALRAKTLPQTETELVSLLRARDYLFEIGGCPVLPYASF